MRLARAAGRWELGAGSLPLYEYQCEACEKRFEKIQKFSDPLVEICPSCGGKVRKLLSSPAIQFKGSGFYITDYPKKSGGSSDGDSKSATPAKDKDTSSSTADSGGSASSTTPAPATAPAKKDPA
jgi:putative FmdB family regulatory protein